jgi:6 kDa early secretory antigenic target
MPDGRLVVKFAELQAAVSQIDNALNKIQSDLDELERSAAPLVNNWSGDARAQYQARQQKWSSAATELSEILRDIRSAVQQSATDYESAERTNAARFQ